MMDGGQSQTGGGCSDESCGSDDHGGEKPSPTEGPAAPCGTGH